MLSASTRFSSGSAVSLAKLIPGSLPALLFAPWSFSVPSFLHPFGFRPPMRRQKGKVAPQQWLEAKNPSASGRFDSPAAALFDEISGKMYNQP